ncbi:uncharacterized protein [Watersipora subatra]|uniref:uncharacterized protein n=1 Tax=Watersipora subatra TaxID=2589382 RepID=UPI00355C0D2E
MDWGGSEESTRLEVVNIYRPARVVAVVCCFIVTLMMIVSICPNDWVHTRETASSANVQREGLFRICSFWYNGERTEKIDCINQDKSYMKGVAALIIIGWILMLAAASLLLYAMLSHLDELKLILYKVALMLAAITGVLLLIALITFPVMVSQALQNTVTQSDWSVGWAYMLGWASLLVIALVVILLSFDRAPDETLVREKVMRS